MYLRVLFCQGKGTSRGRQAAATTPQFPSLIKFTVFFVISGPKGHTFYDQNMNILGLK